MYKTPSIVNDTLSFVMAACLWIGMVSSLSECTYAILSTNGISKWSPGESTVRKRPKRSITYALFSGTMAKPK